MQVRSLGLTIKNKNKNKKSQQQLPSQFPAGRQRRHIWHPAEEHIFPFAVGSCGYFPPATEMPAASSSHLIACWHTLWTPSLSSAKAKRNTTQLTCGARSVPLLTGPRAQRPAQKWATLQQVCPAPRRKRLPPSLPSAPLSLAFPPLPSALPHAQSCLLQQAACSVRTHEDRQALPSFPSLSVKSTNVGMGLAS